MDKKYLALFDLDGTLFDTGDVNFYAYKKALEPFGIALDKTFFRKNCNGRHYMEFIPQIMGRSEHLEEVHCAKKAAYHENLQYAKENTHLFRMIECIRDTYHLAIVTTASRQNATYILQYFGHEDLFELLITQEDVMMPKPDPQGFLLGMQHFRVTPSQTIIFEDSEAGITAARASGAAVVTITQM